MEKFPSSSWWKKEKEKRIVERKKVFPIVIHPL
jgi:hypothetical protein